MKAFDKFYRFLNRLALRSKIFILYTFLNIIASSTYLYLHHLQYKQTFLKVMGKITKYLNFSILKPFLYFNLLYSKQQDAYFVETNNTFHIQKIKNSQDMNCL